MENVTVVFDVLIALISLWVLFKLLGFGGIIGKSLSQIGYGIVICGLAQMIESVGLIYLDHNVFDVHIIHRSILTVGFFLIALGFSNLMKKNINS